MTPEPPLRRPEVTAALDDAARIGPFFALPVPGTAERDAWVPFARLHDDPAPLAGRITQVRDALGLPDGATEDRVAASIMFQGLVARLVAAPLATVVLHRVLPDLSGLARCPEAADPWAPGLPHPSGTRTPDPVRAPGDVASALGAELSDAVVAPLVGVVRGLSGVSAKVLRGNVASSLAGAARVLDRSRPAARPALLGVLAALLEHPSLRGTGRLLRLEEDDPGTEWAFRRNSCCLYYRVPGGGTCGDCVLTAARR